MTPRDLKPGCIYQRGKGYKPTLDMAGQPLGGTLIVWVANKYLETHDEAIDEADAARMCDSGSVMYEELQEKISKAKVNQ